MTIGAQSSRVSSACRVSPVPGLAGPAGVVSVGVAVSVGVGVTPVGEVVGPVGDGVWACTAVDEIEKEGAACAGAASINPTNSAESTTAMRITGASRFFGMSAGNVELLLSIPAKKRGRTRWVLEQGSQ